MTITLTTEIALAIIANIGVVFVGITRIERRLTRMETDIKWIKGECPKCPQNSDNRSQ